MSAPRKSKDGLRLVLFVRVDAALARRVQRATKDERFRRAMPRLSEADLVREILSRHLP